MVEPYPKGMIKPKPRIQGRAFFPGGAGLWITDKSKPWPPMPVNKIMILGQDFDCERGFDTSLKRGEERNSTWRNLIALLESVNIRLEDCFFTNAFMGIREGTKAKGPSPAIKDQAFVGHCRQFFLEQVKMQKPRVIFALGLYVPPFLSPLAQELGVWEGVENFKDIDGPGSQIIKGVRFPGQHDLSINVIALTHPSYRMLGNVVGNVKHRRYKTLMGNDAEIELIKDAVAGLQF